MHSDSKTSRSEGGNNDNNDAEAGTAERRRSGAEAGVSQPEGGQSRSSQAESGQPAGPGRTVRLIRGPGGRLIRTPVAVDIDNDDDELPQQRSGAVRADNLEGEGQRRTVRLVRGPGGQMVDARRVAGWVVTPEGGRSVCPRCEGQAFIRLKGRLEPCPVCQGWRGGRDGEAEIDGMDPRAGRRGRKAGGMRRPLSDEHKEKIRASMAGRKRPPLAEEHKQRISASMRAVHSEGVSRQQISASARGKAKTCALCGEAGHNKRTCPLNATSQASSKRVKGTAYARPEGAPVFRGVTWAASNGCWRAQAWDGSKVQCVGFFDDPEEAARAYDRAAIQLRGDKATTNFPRDDYDVDPAEEPTAPEDDLVEVPRLVQTADESAESQRAAVEAVDAAHVQMERPAQEMQQEDSTEILELPSVPEVQEVAVRAEAASEVGPREGAPPKTAPPRNASGAKTALKKVAAKAPPVVFPLPMTREEAVQGAVEGILRAWAAGKRRQRVELLLPEDGASPFDGGGWPGGVKQQFAAVRPMVEATLMQLKQRPEFRGRLEARWLDESDCVGAWQSDSLAAAVLPTAESLDALREIDADRGGQRLMLVFNPQWQTDGQIVSDFGFGRSKQEAEDFVGSFEDAAVTKRLRIMGDDVRLFRCFPGDWQVHFIWANGQGALLAGVERARPGYERLLKLLRSVPGSKASRSWVDRVNPFTRMGMGSGASVEELLAARDAAERRMRASQNGVRPLMPPAVALSPGVMDDARSGGAPDEAMQNESSSHQQLPDQARLERAGAADRFGGVDIITGRPVRDLKLDPVLQLARWQQSIFGSKDASVDEDADSAS